MCREHACQGKLSPLPSHVFVRSAELKLGGVGGEGRRESGVGSISFGAGFPFESLPDILESWCGEVEGSEDVGSGYGSDR